MKLSMREATRDLSLKIQITGVKQFIVRVSIAAWFFKVGAAIMPIDATVIVESHGVRDED